MKTILAAMLTLFAASAIAIPPTAAKKRCPDGTYYDETKRKCVTRRGS